ncbi:MAG: glycosyl transferase, group 1 [Marmoricola sp.]|jgi:glycosyltransferase involved in cell wall biosynthesis|nr:glycosyl transferase, group 1 [Marmoricola sp.]
MRILHVTDVYRPRVGGIEMFIEELAVRQSAAGHDVSVLSVTPDGPGRHRPGSVTEIRTPQPGPWPLPFLPRGGAVDVSSYDVVHAHLSVVSPFSTRVAQAAVRAGVPVIATVHSMWNGREGWIRIVGTIAGWRRWPVAWTAVSAAAAAAMKVPLGQQTPVAVVPNAVEVPWWREQPAVPERDRPITLVTVMRLAGRKRPLQLLDVLARVRDGVPDEVPLRAVFVGEGPLEDKLRARIDVLGLGDWVELAGACSREQIRELYRHSDAFLAPSHQESFGLAALEARAAGLPVVAMRSGGVGEFVADGVEGFLCRDDEEMTRALVDLATDDEMRGVMVKHNQTHAPELDWSVPLAGFERAYALADRSMRART